MNIILNLYCEIYIDNFNWVSNWIDRHFFNKVSDTLFGILLIVLAINPWASGLCLKLSLENN